MESSEVVVTLESTDLVVVLPDLDAGEPRELVVILSDADLIITTPGAS